MTPIERIHARYFRTTIGTPHGAICHHADCDIYNADLQICTCGLHHDVIVLTEEQIDELYPNFWDEPHGYCVHQGTDATESEKRATKALWEREWGKLQKSLKQLKDEDDGKP